MRRLTAIAPVAATVVAATAAQAAPGPTLQVLRERPAVVRGERFKAGERVTVVLFTTRRWVSSAAANDRGLVVVRFRISLPDCGRYSLQAFGSKGSRARSLSVRGACGDPTK